MYDIPILFIIFKRYDTTYRVFQEIRKIKPKKLYIAGDAGRTLEEQKKCDQTRTIINLVDWDCEIKTLFHTQNHGCKYGPFTAINWFFENEEKGIILEDDCLPNHSFFLFMKEILEKYKDDDRIGMVAGHNPISIDIPYSYIYSRFKGCWGWGTWKRSWINIDIELNRVNYSKEIVPLMVYNNYKRKHWLHALKLINENKVSAWDWPWYFSLASQNQLCVFPCKNLVANIGFGEEGTHCMGDAPQNVLQSFEIEFPLKEPINYAPFLKFELTFENTLTMGQYKFRKALKRIISKFIPKIIKRKIKLLIKKNHLR